MEEKKKNLIFALLSVIIILLVAFIVLVVTGTISFKSDEVNNDDNQNVTENNNIDNGESNNLEKVVIDNENKVNQCQTINDGYVHVNREVIVKNIAIKNKTYTFRYVEDYTNKIVKVYVNNNIAFEGQTSEALLLNVCNYGNYIMYSTGWEGPAYYRIINTDGEEVNSFVGHKVNYSNGILSVEELDKNNIDDINDNELIKYQLNMNSENLQKENLTTEKYVCDPNGSGYDC